MKILKFFAFGSLMWGLSFAIPVLAQQGPGQLPRGFMADYYLSQSDFVAFGHFSQLQDNYFDSSLLVNRPVEMIFTADRVIKTPVSSESNEFTISLLNTDMLAYPGENVSRYKKREELVDSLRPRIIALYERKNSLEQLLENSAVSQEEFDTEIAKIEPELTELSAQITSEFMSVRQLAVIGGESFYDKGGAIKSGVQYLVFLREDASQPNIYILDEDSEKSLVLWGREAENMLEDLERL